MIRKALIIYCDDTPSGSLVGKGPEKDNQDYRAYLRSNLGGHWENNEISSLHNPTKSDVQTAVGNLKGAEYSFIVFTGHGCINKSDGLQYVELKDGDLSIVDLKKSGVEKQTIIIDACRGYSLLEITKAFGAIEEQLSKDKKSTRELFDKAVNRSEAGLIVMYAAGKGQTASTNNYGGLYLRNLVKIANIWKEQNKDENVLTVIDTHTLTKDYISNKTDSIQAPEITEDPKRKFYFPFAVKFTALYS